MGLHRGAERQAERARRPASGDSSILCRPLVSEVVSDCGVFPVPRTHRDQVAFRWLRAPAHRRVWCAGSAPGEPMTTVERELLKAKWTEQHGGGCVLANGSSIDGLSFFHPSDASTHRISFPDDLQLQRFFEEESHGAITIKVARLRGLRNRSDS